MVRTIISTIPHANKTVRRSTKNSFFFALRFFFHPLLCCQVICYNSHLNSYLDTLVRLFIFPPFRGYNNSCRCVAHLHLFHPANFLWLCLYTGSIQILKTVRNNKVVREKIRQCLLNFQAQKYIKKINKLQNKLCILYSNSIVLYKYNNFTYINMNLYTLLNIRWKKNI
jgi:hypothetical protein